MTFLYKHRKHFLTACIQVFFFIMFLLALYLIIVEFPALLAPE